MTIEIGSLVVRGTFGGTRGAAEDTGRLEAEIDRLRQELRAEIHEKLRDLDRRERDR